jgi:hypothetical protein
VRARLEHIDGLVSEEPVRARYEMLKHLDGELTIRSLGGERGRQAFEITGYVKLDSLLAVNQEAGCGRLVAGAGLGRAAPTRLSFSFCGIA